MNDCQGTHYIIDYKCRIIHQKLIDKLDIMFPHNEDATIVSVYVGIEEVILQYCDENNS
jgi:hypothetical protein